MLVAGPASVFIDAPNPNKPVMVPIYGYKGIVLIHRNVCVNVWKPDEAFTTPTSKQTQIVRDLAKDLITRVERACGGKAELITALKAQGISQGTVDPMMRPALATLGILP